MTPICFDPRAQARNERRALIANMRAKLTGKAPRNCNAHAVADEHAAEVTRIEGEAFAAFARKYAVR